MTDESRKEFEAWYGNRPATRKEVSFEVWQASRAAMEEKLAQLRYDRELSFDQTEQQNEQAFIERLVRAGWTQAEPRKNGPAFKWTRKAMECKNCSELEKALSQARAELAEANSRIADDAMENDKLEADNQRLREALQGILACEWMSRPWGSRPDWDERDAIIAQAEAALQSSPSSTEVKAQP